MGNRTHKAWARTRLGDKVSECLHASLEDGREVHTVVFVYGDIKLFESTGFKIFNVLMNSLCDMTNYYIFYHAYKWDFWKEQWMCNYLNTLQEIPAIVFRFNSILRCRLTPPVLFWSFFSAREFLFYYLSS